MTARAISAYHTRLTDLLAPFAESEAREVGFLKRRSKLSGLLFVLTLVSAFWTKTPRSLAAYARIAEDLDPGLSLSPQSLHDRFGPEAVALLERVLASALQARLGRAEAAARLLAPFPRVYVIDSTTIALPETLKADYRGSGGAASASAAKCFVRLEWFSATIREVLLRDGVKADQNMGGELLAESEPEALWLFDLGFWSIAFLASIARHGSVFVSRLYGNVTVRTPEGEAIDVMGWLRGVDQSVAERRITLGVKERLECRLMAERVPEQVAAERRRKAKEGARRRGRGLRAETLERMGWTVWVTNAEEEAVAAAHVKAIYRVRWQVELLFKLAKSTAGINEFASEKKERVECELYAGLIAVVIAGQLGELAREAGEEISGVKLWHALGEKVREWSRSLLKRKGAGALRELIDWVARHAKPTKRKGTPSTAAMIASLELSPP